MLGDFLSTLWGSSDEWFGEIRCLSPFPNGTVRSRFFPTSDTDGAAKWALEQDDMAGFNSFFGVVPRSSSSKGTNEFCQGFTRVLWADVDAKNTGGKYAGLVGIKQARLMPSVIVDSGNGLHAYWLLRAEADWDHAQQAMKGLAREVRGDAVHDRARILRVPGTHNRKNPDKPLPVRFLYYDIERRYRITDFPVIEEPAPLSWPAFDQPAMDLPSWLTDLIAEGAPKGQRSEASFKVVLWMLRYGRTGDEIAQVFETQPIGEKYRERGGKEGGRWLGTTIRAARKANA